jgi:hypothetical protein
VITRLRLDAALYEAAPPRQPGTMGRPRKQGARLPTLAQVLANPTTEWRRVHISEWYGQGERELEIATSTALWFHGGLPGVPIRWVLEVTFAEVRRHLWRTQTFFTSPSDSEIVKISRGVLNRLTDSLAYAA